jgi:predicted naringenin-chalcone synthase
MALKILSLASAPPRYSLDQMDTAQFAAPLCCDSEEQERLIKVLYRRTRIRERGSVLMDESGGKPDHDFFHLRRTPADRGPTTAARMTRFERHAGEMAVRAANTALERADLGAGDVTHLITVSCTGFYAPGIDYDIITGLGLNPEVERVQVGFMGCHAALNAIRVGSSFAEADRKARVLIVSVELCTLHFQYGWDSDQVVSNSLFADGAGAIVGSHGTLGDGEVRSWTAVRNGSCLVPGSADAMTWRIGDHGFQMTLSAQVPELIRRELATYVDRWLSQSGLTRGDIRSWAIHPGGPRILNAAEEALELPSSAVRVSREILAGHGNMSSATMIFLLEKLAEKGAELPCVALGFGPGLTIEAALFL